MTDEREREGVSFEEREGGGSRRGRKEIETDIVSSFSCTLSLRSTSSPSAPRYWSKASFELRSLPSEFWRRDISAKRGKRGKERKEESFVSLSRGGEGRDGPSVMTDGSRSSASAIEKG